MTRSQPTRLEWIDLTRGVLVVLVVLMHATQELAHRAPDTFWLTVNGLLEPVRMPVFFTVSGMLAASALRRPWRQTTRRTWGIALVYVLWTLIFTAVVASSPQVDAMQEFATIPNKLLFAASGYWYLYALPLYFVVARLARGLPRALVIVVAAVPNVLRPWNEAAVGTVLSPVTDNSMAAAVTFNLVFFLVGAFYRDELIRLTRAARWPLVISLAGLLLAAGLLRAGVESWWPHTFLPLSIGWIVVAIMGSSLVAGKMTGATRFACHLGCRTLPIYVLQFPVMVLLTPLLLDQHADAMSNPMVQASYPIVITAAEVALALLLYGLASGTFLSPLVIPPSWPFTRRSPVGDAPRPVTPAGSHRTGAGLLRGPTDGPPGGHAESPRRAPVPTS